jgi:hypothetical protein
MTKIFILTATFQKSFLRVTNYIAAYTKLPKEQNKLKSRPNTKLTDKFSLTFTSLTLNFIEE